MANFSDCVAEIDLLIAAAIKSKSSRRLAMMQRTLGAIGDEGLCRYRELRRMGAAGFEERHDNLHSLLLALCETGRVEFRVPEVIMRGGAFGDSVVSWAEEYRRAFLYLTTLESAAALPNPTPESDVLAPPAIIETAIPVTNIDGGSPPVPDSPAPVQLEAREIKMLQIVCTAGTFQTWDLVRNAYEKSGVPVGRDAVQTSLRRLLNLGLVCEHKRGKYGKTLAGLSRLKSG